MAKSSPEKEARWRKVLQRQQASGLGIRQFCKAERLSEPSFYLWRREIARRDRVAATSRPKQGQQQGQRGSATSRPPRRKPAAAQPAFFVPLRLTSGTPASPLELVHPRGHVVRIAAGCDIESLRVVLSLLDQS